MNIEPPEEPVTATVPEEPSSNRKSWLRRCVGWLLKGALVIAVLLFLLIVFAYAYADWSGARAWAKAKPQIEAAGISLDPNTYIPPPVPDAENFAALPLFQPEPDPKYKGVRRLLALEKALAPIYHNFPYSHLQAYKPGDLPYLGKWERGEKTDLVLVAKELSDFCGHSSPPIRVPAGATPSAVLSLICPALAELRAENLTHPLCRFNQDFSTQSPDNFEPFKSQLELAKILSYDEQLAVLDGQSQVALDDLKVDWKITSGLQKQPLLIDGLVTAAVVSIDLSVVNEGLALHAWNNQQLEELDADLGDIDSLTECQLCLRGDFVVYEIPLIARCKWDRASLMRDSQKVADDYGMKVDWDTYLRIWIEAWLTPNGWYDQYLADYAPLLLPGSMQPIDIASRRIFPERQPISSNLTSAGARNWFGAVKRFAYVQVQVDEARIACRLERYRLSHGNYPDSLKQLTSDYGELPRDIMNGEAYRYKLNSDGTYVLYSVGWNQKDDGGKVDSLRTPDSPDWVWINYPDPK
jgi:hypothetical protein